MLAMADSEVDGIPELADWLGLDEATLRAAIGGPWGAGQIAPELGTPRTLFVGHENPRSPERPLVVIRLDHLDWTVEIGKAVGVPLPTGEFQWTIGEPRTSLEFDPAEAQPMLAHDLQEAVNKVINAAVLRGTTW